MKQQSSSLSLAIRSGLQGVNNAIRAKLASYLGALPSRTSPQASRINSNPNATWSQSQRTQMMWDGEFIVKNSDFGASYVQKRRMYCQPTGYSPDSGDNVFDEELSEYLEERFKTMGINQSMYDAFSQAADVELPMRGDSALVWVRDTDGLRLMVVEADRIGELYAFYGAPQTVEGLNYFCGIYTYPTNADRFAGQFAAFKIYERIDQWYGNAAIYPASDVMFFRDNLMNGFRGVTKFAPALQIIQNRDAILYATMQTMQQQSKIAAIASNNAGEPNEFTYDQMNYNNGTVEYVERFGDGPVTKWQFNGDSYQVLKAEHPTTSFQLAMDKLDAKAARAVGFPYEFLMTPEDIGGAPSRFAFEVAGKEILRLRRRIYTPNLDKIVYVAKMEAIAKKVFRNYKGMMRPGTWNYPTLPSADAFNDVKGDISSIRAGTKTRNDVTTATTGRTYPVVLRKTKLEAIANSVAVQDANRQLEAMKSPIDGKPYEGDITINEIAQAFDNPQQAAVGNDVELGKDKVTEPPVNATAKLSSDEGGVWRTINGTPVFIKDGQSVGDAVEEKFGPVRAKGFHGTNSEFNKLEFGYHGAASGDEGMFGEGIYFSDSFSDARGYGENVSEHDLNFERAFTIHRDSTPSQLASRIEKFGFPGISQQAEAFEKNYGSDVGEFIANEVGPKNFRKKLSKKGFDGVIIELGDGTKNFAVFSPKVLAK